MNNSSGYSGKCDNRRFEIGSAPFGNTPFQNTVVASDGNPACKLKPGKGVSRTGIHVAKEWLVLSACLFSGLAFAAEAPLDSTIDPMLPEEIEADTEAPVDPPGDKPPTGKLEEPDKPKVNPVAGDSVSVPEGARDDIRLTEAAKDATSAPVGAKKADAGIQPIGKSVRYMRSIEELMETNIVSLASLTATDLRHTPASVSLITTEMIRDSGARNVRELLGIYVPGFHSMLSHSVVNTWGMRGIMTDINDKYLLLVNGRKMNETAVYGAATELDLSMLGDLRRVEVIRGPGSALYGSGAIGGVINLVTADASMLAPGQKEATDIRLSTGYVEDYANFSINHIRRLTDTLSLSAFYGVDWYPGVDSGDAPIYYPRASSYNAASNSFGGPVADYNGAAGDHFRHKLMLQLAGDDFRSWVRVTRGGFHGQPSWPFMDGNAAVGNANESIPFDVSHVYTQVTWNNEYTAIWNDWFKSKFEAGIQTYDLENEQIGRTPARYVDTKELMSRLTNTFKPFDGHQLALGGECIWTDYDLSPGYGNVAPFDIFKAAAFAEYQWELSRHWTFFTGARFDYHPHVKSAVSPRAALIFSPTERDTFRVGWDRSFRNIGELNVQNAIVTNGGAKVPNEFIDHWELAYKRKFNDRLDGTLTLFDYKQEFLAFNGVTQSIVGESSVAGVEVELNWRTDHGLRIGVSHGYTKLYDFNQSVFTSQTVTTDGVAPGSPAGSELRNWPSHISKLNVHVPVNDRLSFDGSLVVYWYYQGSADVNDYYRNNPIPGSANGAYPADSDFKPRFGPVFNFNVGATWKFDEHQSLRFDVYNALAFFDKNITVNRYRAENDYRAIPGSVALTYEYRF